MVINVPTRASLAVETKALLFLRLAHLNNKSNVCKQITSLPSSPLCHSALITARSAFSRMISAENTLVGQHPVVHRFLNGAFGSKPPSNTCYGI